MEKKQEKQNNKRLIIILVALLLLLALGATAGFTLAKYASEKTATSNQVTIAKWGVTITVQNDLFGSTYKKGEMVTSGDDVDVKATGKVVAPGTGGSLAVAVSGTPDVSSKLTVTLDEGSFDVVYLVKEDSVYAPIKWSVGGEEVTVEMEGVTDYASYKTALITALKDALADFEVKFSAGQSITAEDLNNLISWEWELNGNDADDTILGNLVANQYTDTYTASSNNYGLTISISLKIRVEQVQAD